MDAQREVSKGDWDVRGRDFETALAGPVTESIIDAARVVRFDFRNGFPNWELYRVVIAGDSLHLSWLRRWVVGFAVAYGMDGGVRRDAYSDEFACVAGWDALHVLMFGRELQPHTTSAEALGVHHKTYRRFRNAIYRRLRASLDEYWVQLVVAYRYVLKAERKLF